jgi:hypothetical protein
LLVFGTSIAYHKDIKPLSKGKAMDIPMELKTFGLLVAILFFLVSLLVNLLQRRYAKTRLGRMLRKEESIVNFLEGIHKNLGKLEVTCTLEVQGESSPRKWEKQSIWYGMRFNRPLLTWRNIFVPFVSTDEKKKHGKNRDKGGRNHIKDPPDDELYEKCDGTLSLCNSGSRCWSFLHRLDQGSRPHRCIRHTHREHLQRLVIRIFWNWTGN